jgi:hypothetical protein
VSWVASTSVVVARGSYGHCSPGCKRDQCRPNLIDKPHDQECSSRALGGDAFFPPTGRETSWSHNIKLCGSRCNRVSSPRSKFSANSAFSVRPIRSSSRCSIAPIRRRVLVRLVEGSQPSNSKGADQHRLTPMNSLISSWRFRRGRNRGAGARACRSAGTPRHDAAEPQYCWLRRKRRRPPAAARVFFAATRPLDYSVALRKLPTITAAIEKRWIAALPTYFPCPRASC